MKKNADLHSHSFYSDGQISPKNLVRLAKKRGIKYLALTDHDSVNGVKEAVSEGRKIGVNIVPGVEVRTDSAEVLGYFIDVNNKELNKKLKEGRVKCQNKIKKWCGKLKKMNFNINFKDLRKKFPKSKNNLNEFYVLFYLQKKGYGTTRSIASAIFAGEKTKPPKIKNMTTIQAIKLIKKAGGVPVLAHPWLGDPRKNFRMMKSYVKAGLIGLEISNGDDLKAMKKISGMKNIVSRIRRVAKRYNLILTRGTDYHGEKIVKLMPGNHNLGSNNCDEKIVEKLKQKI